MVMRLGGRGPAKSLNSTGKSVENKVQIDPKILDSLVKIEEELGTEKYVYMAFSAEKGYKEKVDMAMKFFPSIRIADVSPLSHVPEAERDYQLYTFRFNRTNPQTGRRPMGWGKD